MSASIYRFPLWRCPGCGHYLREPEVAHNRHCKKAQALNRPKQKKAPPRPRGPSKRQRLREALQLKLAENSTLFPLVVRAREGIHPSQLERVAEGRSDFAPSTWRRLAPYLGGDQ
jgi:hypothetical protein